MSVFTLLLSLSLLAVGIFFIGIFANAALFFAGFAASLGLSLWKGKPYFKRFLFFILLLLPAFILRAFTAGEGQCFELFGQVIFISSIRAAALSALRAANLYLASSLLFGELFSVERLREQFGHFPVFVALFDSLSLFGVLTEAVLSRTGNLIERIDAAYLAAQGEKGETHGG